MYGIGTHSRIVADLDAVANNMRLQRDGGFVPTRVKPVVWSYDPQTGSSFERQRVDSRFPNAPTVPQLTALRRKADKQYISAEASRRQGATTVLSRDGGEMPLPGPGRYNKPGTFGRHNADAKIKNGASFKFVTSSRFAVTNERARHHASTLPFSLQRSTG
ncbi:hypothetical protein KFE25_010699 [Diacronema lutheri]|uniref:Uncharacterized protein n=1 Tax=Diacronema lutheri TaxID=2081491 RepID=A0A8J5XC75_DIALT|nr:hypothetical protein KFE25_010699 [Diacronema lutheri]